MSCSTARQSAPGSRLEVAKVAEQAMAREQASASHEVARRAQAREQASASLEVARRAQAREQASARRDAGALKSATVGPVARVAAPKRSGAEGGSAERH